MSDHDEPRQRERLLSLRTVPLPDPEEDFTADPAELFFDLTFVFAFSRLVHLLVHDPTWEGVGTFVLLFAMIWLPWQQFTWSANAVPGNSRPVRLLFMVATVASIPMAASVTSALEGGGPVFVAMLSVILAIALFTMIAGTPPGSELRASILGYSVPNWVAIALMAAGAFADGGVRVGLWIAAIAVVLIGTIRAGSDAWLIRPGHFAERHGLLIIVALGEVIVAIGLPVVELLGDGAGLSGEAIGALVAAGCFAVLLWWSYFDRINPALEHRHREIDDGTASGRYARDVYTWWHFPIIGGLIVAAAALEEITLHPSAPLPAAFRWMMFVGLGGYLVASVGAIVRAFRSVPLERLVATVILGALLAFGGGLDGLLLLIAVDVVLVATLVGEHFRVEVRHRTSGPDAG
ncbi:MAG: low temperature requirement protein A [Microthrixaceae bacterium]